MVGDQISDFDGTLTVDFFEVNLQYTHLLYTCVAVLGKSWILAMNLNPTVLV